LKKEYFIGRAALEEENRRGPRRLLMGLDINWEDVERLYDAVGLAPQVPKHGIACFCAGVPRRTASGESDVHHVVADAEENDCAREPEPRAGRAGTELHMELTVEAVRHKVRATTKELPFFNPPRKTATPVT